MAEDKKYVQVAVSQDTLTTLLRMATLSGRHPSDMAGELIELGLAKELDPNKSEMETIEDPEMAVWYSFHKARRRLGLRNQLKVIARSLISGADEDEIDNFQKLCDGVEFTPQEIMAEAETEESISGSFVELDPKPIADAKMFLLDILSGGKEVSSAVLKIEARKRNISPSALKEARSQLRVVASNVGRQWTVRLPITSSIPPMVVRR